MLDVDRYRAALHLLTDEAVDAACAAYHGGDAIWAQHVHRSPPLARVEREQMRVALATAVAVIGPRRIAQAETTHAKP